MRGMTSGMMVVAGFVLAAVLIVPPIARTIDLNVTCKGYLNRAINANTPELASKQLDKAIENIEKRGWTQGSTKVFFDYPACDIGYWYKNLVSANAELKSLGSSATPLERSNMLMKLRESLSEPTETGERIIMPPNINYHPHQLRWVLWWWSGTLLLGVPIALAFVLWPDY